MIRNKKGGKEPKNLFDFWGKEDMSYSHKENNLIEVFGGLLPETQGEVFEETSTTT